MCVASGTGQQPQRHLERDAEQPLGADEAAEPVGPARSGSPLPSRTTSPSGSTASTPSTWLAVIPCLRQCAPPELKAMLPPIVQIDWLDGIGRVEQPVRRRPRA